MKLSNNIYLHIFISLVFAFAFCMGVHFVYTYISHANYEKTEYPILIYTNTLSEANEVLNSVKDNRNFMAFHLFEPHELTTLLVEKYNLTDYNSLIGDLTLPFLLEIKVRPNKSSDLHTFVNSINHAFPDFIVHYNEFIWKSIDTRVDRLFIIAYIIQALVLITYLSLQLLIRMIYLSNNYETVHAILNSGLTPKKITRIKLFENFMFLTVSSILLLISNYFVNYFMIFKEFEMSWHFFNLEVLLMVFGANLFFALLRK